MVPHRDVVPVSTIVTKASRFASTLKGEPFSLPCGLLSCLVVFVPPPPKKEIANRDVAPGVPVLLPRQSVLAGQEWFSNHLKNKYHEVK